MKSVKTTARIAGILLLIMVFTGPLSMMYVPSQLFVPGDASATANNIAASGSLFNLGIIGHLVILLADIGVAVLLYAILKPVNRIMALFAVTFRLIMVAMRGINLVNYFIVIELVNGNSVLLNFEPKLLHGLVMVFLNAFDYGVQLDLFFFSFHLFFLGYLVYKSGFIPKVFGILLLIGSLGYLISCMTAMFAPDYKNLVNQLVTLPNAVSEVALMFWLLIKGVHVEKWEKRFQEMK